MDVDNFIGEMNKYLWREIDDGELNADDPLLHTWVNDGQIFSFEQLILIFNSGEILTGN